MLKQRKEEIVSALTEELGGVTAMIVADPTGLSVAEMKDLRNRLRPSGAEFRVAKNTLARIAARAAGREALVELLVGPTAITLVPGDPAAAAKTLSDFGRTSRKLELRGAYLDGEAFGADSVKQLATLPSREQLLAQPRDRHGLADQRVRQRAGAAAAQPRGRTRPGPAAEGSRRLERGTALR